MDVCFQKYIPGDESSGNLFTYQYRPVCSEVVPDILSVDFQFLLMGHPLF